MRDVPIPMIWSWGEAFAVTHLEGSRGAGGRLRDRWTCGNWIHQTWDQGDHGSIVFVFFSHKKAQKTCLLRLNCILDGATEVIFSPSGFLVAQPDVSTNCRPFFKIWFLAHSLFVSRTIWNVTMDDIMDDNGWHRMTMTISSRWRPCQQHPFWRLSTLYNIFNYQYVRRCM